jgi:hypothetical protein
MELRKELSYFLQSLDGDDLRNLADGNTTEERLIDEYLGNKAEAKQRAAHHQMLEGATVCSKTEPTKPTINDYPITDERTFLNLNGSVNWHRYAKALDAYIDSLSPAATEKKLYSLDDVHSIFSLFWKTNDGRWTVDNVDELIRSVLTIPAAGESINMIEVNTEAERYCDGWREAWKTMGMTMAQQSECEISYIRGYRSGVESKFVLYPSPAAGEDKQKMKEQIEKHYSLGEVYKRIGGVTPHPSPTAEEILENHVYDIDDFGNKLVCFEGALVAMEEYASLKPTVEVNDEEIDFSHELLHRNFPEKYKFCPYCGIRI